ESALISKYNSIFPEYFALTDPDIEFPKVMNYNVLLILKELTEKYGVYKAGLALCIDADQDFRELKEKNGLSIREWEKQFWTHRIPDDKYEVYKASVGTTFAVYNKKNFRGNYTDGVRLAGSYMCKHLPWYKPLWVTLNETDYYIQ